MPVNWDGLRAAWAQGKVPDWRSWRPDGCRGKRCHHGPFVSFYITIYIYIYISVCVWRNEHLLLVLLCLFQTAQSLLLYIVYNKYNKYRWFPCKTLFPKQRSGSAMALGPRQLGWLHRYGRTARSPPCQDFPRDLGDPGVQLSLGGGSQQMLGFPIAAQGPETGQLAR